ncbi:uncharacterized protein LOC143043302 [Mytilus galloprovincialis]|uniref:uncharacterized protein LOC143043302 n=1 Tax=Mytilus galloprovincialis TaxID=29158 RepID=UPI003F7B58A0
MLFPNETICMVVGIVGIVFFVIAVMILFISCKIRNRACGHETHQESKTELKLDGKEDTRESAVFGDHSPELQRYTKNPTNESNVTAKESDEQGEPNYDYARTGEISICSGNETQNSQEESGIHKKENTRKNEKEATKKVDEHAVIETTEVKRTNVKKPTKRTDLKSGAVHYENETEYTSVKKKEESNRKKAKQTNTFEKWYCTL